MPDLTIWKFPLEVINLQFVAMPRGASILSVQAQGGEAPCVWAVCDPAAETERRALATYGTGHPLPGEPGIYLGTYQIRGGALVFHVFEQTAGVVVEKERPQ